MSAGSRADHQKFCDNDKWQPVTNARGKLVGHHLTYELPLDDGRVLRTRISRPPDTTTYGPSLWNHILTEQIEVTEDEFWDCVKHGRRPNRTEEEQLGPTAGLPAWQVGLLFGELHLTEDQVAAMDEEQAAQAIQEHWDRKGRDRDR